MPKKRKKRKSSSGNENSRTAFIKRILWGSLFSVVFFFVFMLILALVVVKAGLSDSMQNILVFFVSLLSVFAGAFLSLRKTCEKGLMSGFLVSLPVIVFICAVLLAVVKDISVRTAIMSLLMMTGGALGGIAAVNR